MNTPDMNTQAAVRSGVLMSLFEVLSDYWPDGMDIIPGKQVKISLAAGSIVRRLNVKKRRVREVPASDGFWPSVRLVFMGSAGMAKKLAGQQAPLFPFIFGPGAIRSLRFFASASSKISSLMAADFPADSAEYAAQSRLLLCAALRGVCEVAMFDAWVHKKAEHLPTGIMEVVAGTVTDSEFRGYIVNEPGKPGRALLRFIPESRSTELELGACRPTARLIFADLNVAGGVLRGKMNAMDALGDGSLRIQGKLPFIQGIFPLLDRFSFIMGSTP